MIHDNNGKDDADDDNDDGVGDRVDEKDDEIKRLFHYLCSMKMHCLLISLIRLLKHLHLHKSDLITGSAAYLKALFHFIYFSIFSILLRLVFAFFTVGHTFFSLFDFSVFLFSLLYRFIDFLGSLFSILSSII